MPSTKPTAGSVRKAARRRRPVARHALSARAAPAAPGSFAHKCRSLTSLGNPPLGDSELCETCGQYTEYVGDDVFMCFNCD